MGLRKSKPRGFGGLYDDVNTVGEVSATVTTSMVTEHNSTHEDSVTCDDSFAPGTCLTGSKDKVSILLTTQVIMF